MVVEETRVIEPWDYNFWYMVRDGNYNGVVVIIAK